MSNIRVKFVSLSFTFVHNHFENSNPEPSCEIYKAFCLLIVKYALILLLEYTDLNVEYYHSLSLISVSVALNINMTLAAETISINAGSRFTILSLLLLG